MALVNAIHMTERIKICNDFAQVFLDQLSNMAGDSDEVGIRHIYQHLSKNKRTKGKSAYYHVKDTTLIQNMSLKNLLSNIKTKVELTTYLAAKTTLTNMQRLCIASPDTVILLMIVQPCDISFLAGKGNLKRNIPVQPVYNKLRHISASPILGFHDQTGSDMSGRFAGRTKEWCFGVFMACDDDTINYLKCLGHRYLSQEEYDQLERFVCQLCKSYIKACTPTAQLRGRVFPQ